MPIPVELLSAASNTRLAPREKGTSEVDVRRAARSVSKETISLAFSRAESMVTPVPSQPPFLASSATRPITMCSTPTSGRRNALASCCASMTALMARSVNFSNTAVTTSSPRA